MTLSEKSRLTQSKHRRHHRILRAIKDNLPGAPSLDHIIDAVLEHYDIPRQIFFTNLKYRGRDYVMVRQWISYFGYRYHYQLEHIGQAIGRDHSSITHGAKSINTMLEVYPSAIEDRTNIMQIIKRLINEETGQFKTSNQNHNNHVRNSFCRPACRTLIGGGLGINPTYNRPGKPQLGKVHCL